ncbi:MAG: zinc ribbon-containing protein [Aquisalimonadaceae bacterium]
MPDDKNRRQLEGYEKMLERVTHLLQEAGDQARPRLRDALHKARERAVELGELTGEEAERIGDYIRRDVEDAARYLSRDDTDDDLAGWFRMDLQLIESWLLDRFTSVADRTRLEWDALQQTLERAARWHTGEITGPGQLRCTSCGKVLEFERTGHIPPCPACSSTLFERLTVEDEEPQG